MKAFCRVFQLESNEAYFNIDNDVSGAVAIWGNEYKRKTILAQEGCYFYLIQFDTDAYYDEWMEENSKNYTKFTLIEEVEKIK